MNELYIFSSETQAKACVNDHNSTNPQWFCPLINRGCNKECVFMVPAWWQTPSQYQQLQATLSSTEFVDATGLIDGVRVIKSEPELACIREAGKILTDAMYEGINTITDGRTENDVASKILERLMLRGSDPVAFWPTVSSGPRTALPHNVWSC